MEYVLIGLISAANLIVIKMKLERSRFADAILDFSAMVGLGYIFSGSYGGMVVAMVASLAISVYLFISPPKFTTGFYESVIKEIQAAKDANK